MNRQEIIKKLNSTILCLMAHPDNEPDSEFADRIDDLISIEDSLSEEGKEEKECNEIISMENNRCITCGAKSGHPCELTPSKD